MAKIYAICRFETCPMFNIPQEVEKCDMRCSCCNSELIPYKKTKLIYLI